MIKSKNFLLVISKFPPEYSGPGVRIPRLYNWLKEKDPDVSLQVLCNGIENPRSEIYQHKGIPVRRIVASWLHRLFRVIPLLPARYRTTIIYQAEFLQTLCALMFSKTYKNTDFLHLAGHSGATAAALCWAKMKNIPVLMELVTEHAMPRQKGFLFFQTPIPDRFMVIALTSDKQEKCIKNETKRSDIWLRPNPISEEKFFMVSEKEKLKLRQKLSIFSDQNIVISSVGKMIPQKNQILIIETMKHLPTKFVAMIGGPLVADGPLKDRDIQYVQDMKDLIVEYELQGRVQLVPDFVSAEEYMKASDVYLMPAWNEGFGTPMLEAMGCGCPVVANKDEKAFQEWVVDGENGFICDIENPQDWAQAIENISQLQQERRIGISKDIHKKAGQKVIYAHYERIINQLMVEN